MAATFTVSLGGVAPLPAISRRGSTMNADAPAAAFKNTLLFIAFPFFRVGTYDFID
jgi:hypothetical protein